MTWPSVCNNIAQVNTLTICFLSALNTWEWTGFCHCRASDVNIGSTTSVFVKSSNNKNVINRTHLNTICFLLYLCKVYSPLLHPNKVYSPLLIWVKFTHLCFIWIKFIHLCFIWIKFIHLFFICAKFIHLCFIWIKFINLCFIWIKCFSSASQKTTKHIQGISIAASRYSLLLNPTHNQCNIYSHPLHSNQNLFSSTTIQDTQNSKMQETCTQMHNDYDLFSEAERNRCADNSSVLCREM